jgi:redox-sensitive bicupin YhaK (pirin superfamily)
MIEARPSATLGATRRDGIEALHHFCFAGYHVPGREGWGGLAALNQVTLAPRAALRPEPIDGVELLAIVRKGVIAHAGSLGGNCRTVAGEVQLISPGPGITHADVNPATRPAEYVELRLRAAAPAEFAERKAVAFPTRSCLGQLSMLASGHAADHPAMMMHADARVLGAALPPNGAIDYPLEPGRHAYVLALSGTIVVNGTTVEAPGGAAILDEPVIQLAARELAELLLVDAC